MAPTYRHCQGHTQAVVSLQIVVPDAVDCRCPPEACSDNCRLHAGTKTIEEMPLQRIDRVLLARTPAEKIILVQKEPGSCKQLRRQRPPRLGKVEFRFDGSAVGAVVHHDVGIVLSERNRQLETRPYDRVLAIIPQLLERKGGRAEEIKPRNGTTPRPVLIFRAFEAARPIPPFRIAIRMGQWPKISLSAPMHLSNENRQVRPSGYLYRHWSPAAMDQLRPRPRHRHNLQ